MDFSTIKQAVQDDGGFATPDATTRIGQWVNSAYNELLSRRGWSFLEATPAAVALVASQQNYVLAGASAVLTDFGGLIDVNLETTTGGIRVKLVAADQQVFDMLSGHSRVAGVPSVYTVAGGAPATTSAAVAAGGKQDLLVWPIPLATAGNGQGLIIRYYRHADTVQLSANGDVPIVPVRYHDVIVQLACARGAAAYDDASSAQAFRQSAELRIAAMIEEDERIRPIRDNERLTFGDVPDPDPRLQAQRTASRQYPQSEHR